MSGGSRAHLSDLLRPQPRPETAMLTGRRISLGPIMPSDFAQLFCWANDVASARLDFTYRPVDMKSHMQWCESLGQDPSRVAFAIRQTGAQGIIGYVQISAINGVHRSADVGIRIGEEQHRGQGFGQEALRLALDYAWNHLNLNRLQLIAFHHNARAIGAYAAVGFRREGRLRKAAFIDGEWIDLVVMGALRPGRKAQTKSQIKSQTAREAPQAAVALTAAE
jgi:RimJ/RimL family protein N-acetyltransferase